MVGAGGRALAMSGRVQVYGMESPGALLLNKVNILTTLSYKESTNKHVWGEVAPF